MVASRLRVAAVSKCQFDMMSRKSKRYVVPKEGRHSSDPSIDHGHLFLSFYCSVQLRLLLSVFDCLKCFDKFVFGLRVKGRLVYPSLGYCKRERY